jgi:hypothetical protein
VPSEHEAAGDSTVASEVIRYRTKFHECYYLALRGEKTLGYLTCSYGYKTYMQYAVQVLKFIFLFLIKHIQMTFLSVYNLAESVSNQGFRFTAFECSRVSALLQPFSLLSTGYIIFLFGTLVGYHWKIMSLEHYLHHFRVKKTCLTAGLQERHALCASILNCIYHMPTRR